MAAPAIPPIRLGLIGTGNHTASYLEIPAPSEPYGTEGVLAGSSSERRVTRGSSASFAA